MSRQGQAERRFRRVRAAVLNAIKSRGQLVLVCP